MKYSNLAREEEQEKKFQKVSLMYLIMKKFQKVDVITLKLTVYRCPGS